MHPGLRMLRDLGVYLLVADIDFTNAVVMLMSTSVLNLRIIATSRIFFVALMIHSDVHVVRRKKPTFHFWEHALLESRIDIPSLDLIY